MIKKNNQSAARIDHVPYDKLETLKKSRVAYIQKTINFRWFHRTIVQEDNQF